MKKISRRMVHPRTLVRALYYDVAATREMVNLQIARLKEDITNPVTDEKSRKDDPVSSLVKLTGLLMKLVPMERELLSDYKSYYKPREKKQEGGALQYPLPFTEEDKAILARYREEI